MHGQCVCVCMCVHDRHASHPAPRVCLPALCCLSPAGSLSISNEAWLPLSSFHCRRKRYCSSPRPTPSRSTPPVHALSVCFLSSLVFCSPNFLSLHQSRHHHSGRLHARDILFPLAGFARGFFYCPRCGVVLCVTGGSLFTDQGKNVWRLIEFDEYVCSTAAGAADKVRGSGVAFLCVLTRCCGICQVSAML